MDHSWPKETRMILRRERPHPDGQFPIFDKAEEHRHTAFMADTADAEVVGLGLGP
jgi:hypothetical protein